MGDRRAALPIFGHGPCRAAALAAGAVRSSPATRRLGCHEDPDGEAARQYHIVAYRRLQKVLEEHELQRRAEEAKKMRREQAVASIEVSRSSKEEERQREREKQQWENKVARFQKQSSFQKSKPSAEPGEEQEDEEEMLSDDSL